MSEKYFRALKISNSGRERGRRAAGVGRAQRNRRNGTKTAGDKVQFEIVSRAHRLNTRGYSSGASEFMTVG